MPAHMKAQGPRFSRAHCNSTAGVTALFVVACIFFSFAPSAHATTIITGDVTTDTTWTKDGSPYVVEDGFVLNTGVTLTIQPGVIVKFDPYVVTAPVVQGRIIAQGTPDENIIFTSLLDDTAGGDTNEDGGDSTPYVDDWSLSFGTSTPATASTFDHVSFKYTDTLSFVNTVATMTHADISFADTGLVADMGSALTLHNVSFHNLGNEAIILNHQSVVTATNSLVDMSGSDGDALLLFNNSTLNLNSSVVRNIDASFRVALNILSSHAILDHSTFENGHSEAILLFDDRRLTPPLSHPSSLTMNNSVIQNFGDAGMLLFDNATITVADSTIDHTGASAIGLFDSTASLTRTTLENGDDTGIELYDSRGSASLPRTSLLTLTDSTIEHFFSSGILSFDGSVSIDNSHITNNMTGIESYTGRRPASEESMTITHSTITGNTQGIVNYGTPQSDGTILTTPIDARNNWWGDTSGPFNPATNPNGVGDSVSDNVTFEPWTGEVIDMPLGVAASNLAKELVNQNYLWGGKGWDFSNKLFTDTAAVETGYRYWNPDSRGFASGNGVDCSGLIAWSYDRTVDPATYFTSNFIKYENADGQYKYNTQSVTESELQPGDLLFFDNLPKDGHMDHVAMYVGGDSNSNVVQASSPSTGIKPASKDSLRSAGSFVAFARPKNSIIAMSITKHSPVHLSVTDPDGHMVSDTSGIATDEEYLRESGDLYYATMGTDANGYSEDVAYSPVLKQGAYRITVSPMASTTPDQTYSLDFTAGSTTIALAHDLPLSHIPIGGYGLVVGQDNGITLDTTPPEAAITLSTSTKKILITGTDNLSSTTVATTATSSTITDIAGNTLTLAISKNITKPNYANLVAPSFSYSTGSTTNATTSLRYFWSTNTAGAYNFFVSALQTPTERILSFYTSFTNKTYLLQSTSTDDTTDFSVQISLLLLRKKLQTFTGMVVPHMVTSQGRVVVGY